MHQFKQLIQPKPQFQQQSTVEPPEAMATSPTPLAQQISRMGNMPNPSTHAAMLNRFPGERSPSNPQFLLQLQRQYGNRYVNRVLQKSQQAPIQTQLTVGAVGDKYEQEADRISKQVVNQINPPASHSSTQNLSVQRQEMPEEDELMMKPMVQRSSDERGMAASSDLEASINQEKGNGQPLPATILQPLQNAFGADFSRVKVHTDAKSDQLNQAIQARAFTTGQDIFFGQGEYQPGSKDGQELITHELTHVVQQGGQQIANTAGIQPSDASESGEVIQRVRWPWGKNKKKVTWGENEIREFYPENPIAEEAIAESGKNKKKVTWAKRNEIEQRIAQIQERNRKREDERNDS